jgi:D-arabinose 1-dehydrogenase-like Zn-dependent alcohol dehydrogenase
MTGTIDAVVFPGSGEVVLTTKPVPVPGHGEVLLGLRAAGVCGSDLHFMHQTAEEMRHSDLGKGMSREPSLTPGHEIAGVVEALGEGVTSLRLGDRVAVQHYSGCGQCRTCRMGWDALCDDKVVYTLGRDGGFQDKVTACAKDCLRIPDGMSYTTATFIACGAGTSFQAVRRGELKAGETLASVGLGPVGLSGLLWGKASGARTVGLDTNAERRDFAKSKGVDLVLDPLQDGLLDEIERFSGRPGADVVLETAGNSPGRRLACEITRPWGTAVYISFGGICELDAAQHIVQKQITLRGSWMFSVSTMMEALAFAQERGVDLEGLVTRTCSLPEAPRAIKDFDNGAVGKTVILWDDLDGTSG